VLALGRQTFVRGQMSILRTVLVVYGTVEGKVKERTVSTPAREIIEVGCRKDG